MLVFGADASIPADLLYATYEHWCRENGVKAVKTKGWLVRDIIKRCSLVDEKDRRRLDPSRHEVRKTHGMNGNGLDGVTFNGTYSEPDPDY